jgi:hypothetical protein
MLYCSKIKFYKTLTSEKVMPLLITSTVNFNASEKMHILIANSIIHSLTMDFDVPSNPANLSMG